MSPMVKVCLQKEFLFVKGSTGYLKSRRNGVSSFVDQTSSKRSRRETKSPERTEFVKTKVLRSKIGLLLPRSTPRT